MSACLPRMKRLLPVVLAAAAGLLAVGGVAVAQAPGAPTITSVTSGDGALAVAWSAPSDPGGSTVTSYDLRHIDTSADETVDADWTVENGVWTSGSLEHTVGGLTGETSHDVQVRAVNGDGPGDWSATVAGTPRIGAPTIYFLFEGDGALTFSWTAPPAPEDAITSYDLRHIDTSADETVDSNWTVLEDIGTSGSRRLVFYGLTNGTGYDLQVRAVTSGDGAWSATAAGTPADYGDTRTAATTIPLDTTVGGMIDPATDADFLKLEIVQAAGVAVYTVGDLDTFGQLLDSDGDLIEENDDYDLGAGPLNFLVWDSLKPGTHYVKVTSFDGSTGHYRLVATAIVDTTGPGNAQPIPLAGIRHAMIDPVGDVDWFTFTLAEQAGVIVRGSYFVDGEIRDAADQPVADFESFGLPASGFLHKATLAAGQYYIRTTITPGRLFPALYTVRLSEAAEPGSTLATALALTPYVPAVGTIDPSNDADYFRIDVDGTLQARVLAVGADIDIAGELLDSSGAAVGDAVLFEDTFEFGGPTGFTLLDELGAGTHYIKVTGSPNQPTGAATGSYAVVLSEDLDYTELIDGCTQIATSFSDPLYGCQWHLDNSGQKKGTPGEDINAEGAWTVTQGSGVNVAVVDAGMHYDHRDLRDNVDRTRNHDYTGGGDIYDPAEDHGTQVAGIIAARANDIGMRGVAPQATIYGYNALLDDTDLNLADAMARNMDVTAVSNNSWGAEDNTVGRAPELWERAVDSGVTSGFDGKGVFYVFAAGNGGTDGDNSNLDEYVNYYAVTAACAVNDLGERVSYSEKGANLWVCAPSDELYRPGIATTTNFHRYTGNFSGTSAAAPQVSGVAALVRSVDSTLSWRDLKLILAASARKNDPDDPDWQTGALQHGSDPSDPQHYEFNHSYGFGVVDAAAAVDLAGDWSRVPEMRKTGPVGASAAMTIPNNGTVSSTVAVDSGIDFVEFVEVNATFDAPYFRGLQTDLVSPSGAVSALSPYEFGYCLYQTCKLVGSFRFGSARHLGEDPSGNWTLRIADRWPGAQSNRLESWSITVYGHRATPEAPTLNFVDPGTDSLTVSWTAPDDTGASDVTGYDVRHVRSDSTSKADDSAWTVIAGAAAAGARSYTVAMLDDGHERDVQVRAVNGRGAGDWSATASGTPGAANSEPFFVEGSEATRTVREDAAAGESIGEPLTAAEADSDPLAYSLGGPDAAVFGIDSSTGRLQVKDPLDYETTDTYRVTVSVGDGKDAAGDADTAVDATIDVTVVVTDVDEPPEVTGDTEIGYAENSTDEVIEYTAEDPEGLDVTWTLSGTDSGDFYLVDGKLEFFYPPDREYPTDADGRNDYEITVTASDGANETVLDVTVTVLDENEPIEVTGDEAPSFVEDDTGVVAVYDANDPENGIIQWSLTGTDAGDLRISGGLLRFASAPDFDRPADSNRDNVYRITVRAFDGANSDTLNVTVTVTDLDEPGTLSLSSDQPQVRTALTAELDDPDGETGVSWLWESSPDGFSGWAPIDGATSSSYTPVEADEGHWLRVTVTYSDRHVSGMTLVEVTGNAVQAEPAANTAPEFPSGEDGTRTVAENGFPGQFVGAPVRADDIDNDALVYEMSGSDSSLFEIDRSSGQLRTAATLDFETRSRYSFTITATDPSRAADSVGVTVNVENEDEDASLTLSADQPLAGTALSATLVDADGRPSNLDWTWESSPDGFSGWAPIAGATSSRYTPVEADLGQYLRVTVTYTDGHGPGKTERTAADHPVGKVIDPGPGPSPGGGGSFGGRGFGGGSFGGGGGPGPSSGGGPAAVVEIGGAAYTASDTEAVFSAAVSDGTTIRALRWTVTGPGGFAATSSAPRFVFVAPAGGTYTVSVTVDDAGGRTLTGSVTLTVLGDITGQQFVDEILWLAEEGITRGCAAHSYCPSRPVTRAQMAAFLARALDLETPPQRAGFADVEPSGVHAGAIEALYGAQVTVGCAQEPLRYCPSRPVTRAQMAAFLARALDLETPPQRAGFADVEPSGVHAGAIEALYGAQVTVGCASEPLRYCPDRPVTRAQMAAFLYRARDLIAAAASSNTN